MMGIICHLIEYVYLTIKAYEIVGHTIYVASLTCYFFDYALFNMSKILFVVVEEFLWIQ